MLHVQLPKFLPMLDKESTIAASRGNNIAQQKQFDRKNETIEYNYAASTVNELPSGYLGKLRVYRNGTRTLDIGGTLYKVTEGTHSTSAQVT